MNNDYLKHGLAGGPASFRAIAVRIPADQWDRPTGPGRFTPREVIAHLADWEPRLRGRIETALSQPGMKVQAWDEGELASENNYAASDWQERLRAFESERASTVALIDSLSPEQFDSIFTHPEKGPMKIEDQAAFFMGHDLYHLSQLSALI